MEATWAVGFMLSILCGGLTVGGIIAAIVLATRQSSEAKPPSRARRAIPERTAGPGYRFLVIALIGGLILVTFLNILRALRLGESHGDPDKEIVLTTVGGYLFVSVIVGLLALVRLAWIAATRPPADNSSPPTGPGYKLLLLGWIGAICALGFTFCGTTMTGSGARTLGFRRDAWEVFSSLAVILAVSVGLFTVARYLWMNRKRLADSFQYAHEPPVRRATPILPTSALVPTPMPRSCPRCGASLADGAPQGLCPRCLLQQMMPVPERLSPTIAHGPFVPPTVEEVSEFFPQFEILRIVGQGGMGAVYLARQKALDRMVAIKLIRTAHEDDPTFAARFAREAKAMAKLSHPNIVHVHDTGEAGGLPYFVMEYVDGITLRDAIRSKSLTSAQALMIIPQICDALDYAHKQGVVHRDIKPENILLDPAGKVKIADFGLAKMADPNSMSLTGTLQAMGTPHYMAPEQWEKPSEVDHRADIYALGVVLYELLTGELPLGRFDPPSVKSRVDARIDELVLRALAKEPDRRYQHATDVKLALAQIAANPGWVKCNVGFREYKSKTTFLGWPLVHVVSGRDPMTGRGKVAQGWLAVGDQAAVGGIAIGGATAVGGIAVAGAASVGLVALAGGGAMGLLAMSGGVSIGGLFACAGAAAASPGLAVAGGAAWGNYALAGGAGEGGWVWASNRQDDMFWPRLNGYWDYISRFVSRL